MTDVKNILEEIHASLEPHRKARVDAQDRQGHAEALQQQAMANVFRGQCDARDAHQRLEQHQVAMKVQKDARIQARVEQIGDLAQAHEILEFDMEGRRLSDAAEEADAVLAKLQEINDGRIAELQQAEAAVFQAEAAITQAYLDGVASRIIESDSIMRGLHTELADMTFGMELTGRPGAARASTLVAKALSLVTSDSMNMPVYRLPGGPAADAWKEANKARMKSQLERLNVEV